MLQVPEGGFGLQVPIRPHSFHGSGPAIFPASLISSHACIVFLSEASSSSHLGQRYLGSKGVRAHRQEDGVLGSLAAPGHREESASHHIKIAPGCQDTHKIQYGLNIIVDIDSKIGLSSHGCTWTNATKIIKNQIF